MAAHLDDQQELENFKYFWRSKGRWLFAVLLLASLVYLGWVLYQGHIKTKNEEAATALAGLVEKAKTSQDKQTLQADLSILQQNYPESISSAQATMMVAADLFDQGQYEAAEKQLNWVLQNQQIPFVRALAIQRLATVQLQQKKYDAALATLKMPVDTAFEALILETQGDVLYAQGKNKEALAVYEQALAYADLHGTETVIDAYCGTGTITLFLAQRARKVYGIEIVQPAILDARKNARDNHIKNAEFIVGDTTAVMPALYKQGIRPDVVVVDPPRAGCSEPVLCTFANMRPQRIVYVSCNPATLARDLAILKELGYITQEVQPVDLFPQTSHVENVALITKKSI